MKLTLVLVLAMSSLVGAAFVPPADGPVPFRRDKLPVDVDTMMALSKQLVVLAAETNTKNPKEARRAAQMLGLSLALDPTNRRSLQLTKRLEGGSLGESAGSGEVDQATSRAWHLTGWLAQPEAGADGNALAACLTDILVSVDPGHPRAVERDGKGEQGKWKGWVAPLDAFKDAKKVVVSKDDKPEPPSNKVDKSALKIPEASVEIPLWYTEKESKKLVFRPVAVKMEAKISGDGKELWVKLPGENQSEQEAKVGKWLKTFLAGRYEGIPNGLGYRFSFPKGVTYSEGRNGKVLLGAILVLADSALSGKAPQGMVFAEVDNDGSLKVPTRFWQTIRLLADQKPGRQLVLPASAKDFMPALITLDKAEFFFNFEVLMASDAASLCELASSSPPEKVVQAHAAFGSIRKARGSRSLGGFLTHSSTQQRLKQLISIFPDHVSARMLALRGTSQWPKRLTREIYAREIRAVMEPFGKYFKTDGWSKVDGKELEANVDASREQLAAIEKLFASVSDRQELHTRAMNVAKILSSLADDAKRSSSDDGSRWDHEPAFREAWGEYVNTMRYLTFAVGDSKDYPLEKEGK
ncbi:hypothetical protein [Haloferula sp.]|uniref:hypothetical protein n=1 Tax=Haloferula sp. TaxID=2497595 RepID=UPI0032A06178